MKICVFITMFILMFATTSQAAVASAGLDEAFKLYAGDSKQPFSADRGKELWTKKYKDDEGGKEDRHCGRCHGPDLTKKGKHIKTGKVIKPLAPSANSERFTKLKKIKKWFKRNCKWVMGRECTSQEKGDILKYLSQL